MLVFSVYIPFLISRVRPVHSIFEKKSILENPSQIFTNLFFHAYFKSLAELQLFGLEERREKPCVAFRLFQSANIVNVGGRSKTSSVLFLQFAVCRNCAYRFSHVMDSQDVGTEAESLVVEYLTLRERFFRSYAELPEYHALA